MNLAESAAIENPAATLPVTASNERRLATFSEPLQVDAQFEQGIEFVVIKEIIGHAHIGVTAGVYAHVRLRLQRQAIDTLNVFLGQADEDPVDPLAAAVVR